MTCTTRLAQLSQACQTSASPYVLHADSAIEEAHKNAYIALSSNCSQENVVVQAERKHDRAGEALLIQDAQLA